MASKAIPKQLRNFALKHKLHVGRQFDSSGKHAFYFSRDDGHNIIRQSASGMLAYLRNEVAKRKKIPRANPARKRVALRKRTTARANPVTKRARLRSESGLRLAKSVVAVATKTERNSPLLQARVSYAQGVVGTCSMLGVITPSEKTRLMDLLLEATK